MRHLLACSVAVLLGGLARTQCAKPCFAMFDDAVFDSRVSMGGPNLLLAIKFRTPVAVPAQRLEVFTGKRSGPGTVAIWSHKAAGNLPGTKLASSSYLQTASLGWQGANLARPQVLAANTDYWFVWGMPSGSQASIRRRQPQNRGQTYRGSFNGGQSWNGPWSSFEWKLRVWCCRKTTGAFTPFGTSCGPRGQAPQIGSVGLPTVGKTYQVTVSRTLPGRPAMLTLGASKTAWGPFKLPLDLTRAGAPGCTLLCSIDAAATRTTNGSGFATQAIPVPNDRRLIGLQFHHQWIVFGPVNTLGALFSNAATVRLGG